MLVDCNCSSSIVEPRIVRNLDPDELDVLLDRDKILEYRYYRKWGSQSIIKVIHCHRCKKIETHLNRYFKG